ncbi:MAG: glycine--tRNA ligase [Myxococcales bacterium]|nr:glycine--tRNA ligase [Myxococcales bacterium]MCB9551721.1 glycine--tRNA ligase [Myxococcales bacterium]
MSTDLMQKVISLCKRRGFVFQSSEIYGGLRSAYDYGPLGVELKRNLMNRWWRDMVHSREDVVGLDASIIMHPRVWEASGHLAGFSDPLVDCKVCKERFRADKAPRAAEGEAVTLTFADKARAKTAQEVIASQFGVELERRGAELHGAIAGSRGYVCPVCRSPYLSDERQFNLMFRTSLGAIDPLGAVAAAIESGDFAGLTGPALRAKLDGITRESAVYLRPETAQAMFVQFQNVQQSMALKVPFGIAQMGKSFRNEITVEHFIFRSCEFEQMEMEFFCEPGTDNDWLDYWCTERMGWWKRYANESERFRLRPHEPDELAHYAKGCYDIEYLYPWGWGELEGIANRTDYDLKKHAEHSGTKLEYFDPTERKRFTPYVIEPAAGATRGVLVYLLDAYHEETVGDDTRVVMRLHPQLAPVKVAVLPLVKKNGMPEKARAVVEAFFRRGINAKYDEQHAIGKRYRRHDEIGTPWCLTIDGETLENDTITLRDRDTMAQRRISIEDAVTEIEALLRD